MQSAVFRGIGRLSRELALAMARDSGSHEVLLALNGVFPEAADDLLTAFDGVLDRRAIRFWHAAGGTASIEPDSEARRLVSEHIRARFLRGLAPDVVHVSSLFEGIGDDVITSLPPPRPQPCATLASPSPCPP